MVRAGTCDPIYRATLAHFDFPLISCARACTVASEVFTEAQSFADCKLHIRTRLLAFGFQQFLENPFPCLFLDLISGVAWFVDRDAYCCRDVDNTYCTH